MNDEFIFLSEKANMRRFGRNMSRFDPNAIDADADGVVQEGTPFKRPAPRRMRMGDNPKPSLTGPRQSFWNYAQPRITEVPDDLLEEEVDKPSPQNWRNVPLKPRNGDNPVDDVRHDISSSKVNREEWADFQTSVLERIMKERDDLSLEKRQRRGILKLYAALKRANPKTDSNGNLVVTLTDTERARILKGITSMKAKKYDIPNMDIIFEMLEAAEKKTALILTGFSVGRPFVGVRYKNTNLMHVTLSDTIGQNPRLNILGRKTGYRAKGDTPRQRVDFKALGRSLAGTTRSSGRMVTARFDPNAVDADGDGIVQDATPFERPATPSGPSVLQGQKPTTGPLPEGRKRPQKQNSIMKAQADRKAMNFQIEKLRSTLRRVGNDYVPSWWNTDDDKEFEKNIQAASPEELSEIFARIYAERRSLMTAKVGRLADGTVKVFADTPDKKSSDANAKLKKRGEAVYREMFGRITPIDADAANVKKRGKQFSNWYKMSADNADWYFEQSFKVSKRKKRRKLGINAPVNRRGTRWADDPNFPEESFEKVIESIETDLRRANPSISGDTARRRAENIVSEADKRLSRTPNKTPRISGDRGIVDNKPFSRTQQRRLQRRIGKIEQPTILPVARENLNWYMDKNAQAPIPVLDSGDAMKNMNDIFAQNQRKFGQLQTFDEFKAAFKTLSPNIKADFFQRKNANRTPSEQEKAILHGYLHAITMNPQIAAFPIQIKAQDKGQTTQGIGGSHGMRVNLDDPSKPTFTHVFSYAAPEDLAEYRSSISAMADDAKANGRSVDFRMVDSVSNQVVKDFLTKNITPNMSQRQKDSVYEQADRLEQFLTSLHEGGHGAHSAAEMIDRWGVDATPAGIRQELEGQLDGFDDAEFMRSSRGTLYQLLKNESDNYLNSQTMLLLNQSGRMYDWVDIYDAIIDNDGDVIRALSSYPSFSQQQILGILNNYQPEELAVYAHFTRWQRLGGKKYSIEKMEQLITDTRNDPFLTSINMPIKNYPMTSAGKIDIKKLRDKTPGANNGLNFYEQQVRVGALRLAHSEFQYDSLTDAEKTLVAPLLEQFSDYAKRTSRYGPAYGTNSNVESIAELNALSLSNLLDQKTANMTAEEKRVIQLLVTWLGRDIP